MPNAQLLATFILYGSVLERLTPSEGKTVAMATNVNNVEEQTCSSVKTFARSEDAADTNTSKIVSAGVAEIGMHRTHVNDASQYRLPNDHKDASSTTENTNSGTQVLCANVVGCKTDVRHPNRGPLPLIHSQAPTLYNFAASERRAASNAPVSVIASGHSGKASSSSNQPATSIARNTPFYLSHPPQRIVHPHLLLQQEQQNPRGPESEQEGDLMEVCTRAPTLNSKINANCNVSSTTQQSALTASKKPVAQTDRLINRAQEPSPVNAQPAHLSPSLSSQLPSSPIEILTLLREGKDGVAPSLRPHGARSSSSVWPSPAHQSNESTTSGTPTHASTPYRLNPSPQTNTQQQQQSPTFGASSSSSVRTPLQRATLAIVTGASFSSLAGTPSAHCVGQSPQHGVRLHGSGAHTYMYHQPEGDNHGDGERGQNAMKRTKEYKSSCELLRKLQCELRDMFEGIETDEQQLHRDIYFSEEDAKLEHQRLLDSLPPLAKPPSHPVEASMPSALLILQSVLEPDDVSIAKQMQTVPTFWHSFLFSTTHDRKTSRGGGCNNNDNKEEKGRAVGVVGDGSGRGAQDGEKEGEIDADETRRIVDPKYLSLFAVDPPEICVEDYLRRLIRSMGCTPDAYIYALCLIHRISRKTTDVAACFGTQSSCRDAGETIPVTNRSIHRLLLTSLVIAAKMRNDTYFGSAHYAAVGGVEVGDLLTMEIAFLQLLGFNATVRPEHYCDMVYSIRHHCSLLVHREGCTWAEEAWAELIRSIGIPSASSMRGEMTSQVEGYREMWNRGESQKRDALLAQLIEQKAAERAERIKHLEERIKEQKAACGVLKERIEAILHLLNSEQRVVETHRDTPNLCFAQTSFALPPPFPQDIRNISDAHAQHSVRNQNESNDHNNNDDGGPSAASLVKCSPCRTATNTGDGTVLENFKRSSFGHNLLGPSSLATALREGITSGDRKSDNSGCAASFNSSSSIINNYSKVAEEDIATKKFMRYPHGAFSKLGSTTNRASCGLTTTSSSVSHFSKQIDVSDRVGQINPRTPNPSCDTSPTEPDCDCGAQTPQSSQSSHHDFFPATATEFGLHRNPNSFENTVSTDSTRPIENDLLRSIVDADSFVECKGSKTKKSARLVSFTPDVEDTINNNSIRSFATTHNNSTNSNENSVRIDQHQRHVGGYLHSLRKHLSAGEEEATRSGSGRTSWTAESSGSSSSPLSFSYNKNNNSDNTISGISVGSHIKEHSPPRSGHSHSIGQQNPSVSGWAAFPIFTTCTPLQGGPSQISVHAAHQHPFFGKKRADPDHFKPQEHAPTNATCSMFHASQCQHQDQRQGEKGKNEGAGQAPQHCCARHSGRNNGGNNDRDSPATHSKSRTTFPLHPSTNHSSLPPNVSARKNLLDFLQSSSGTNIRIEHRRRDAGDALQNSVGTITTSNASVVQTPSSYVGEDTSMTLGNAEGPRKECLMSSETLLIKHSSGHGQHRHIVNQIVSNIASKRK